MSNPKRLFPKLKKRLSRFRLQHTYWTLTDSAGKASFAVVGNPGGRHPYKRLFLDDQEGIKIQSHLYKGGSGAAGRLLQNRGLVVLSDLEIPGELAQHTVQVPNFVELAIDLPATLEDYYSELSHSARDDIRRARKANYQYEVSRDVNWTEDFFNRYYWPSMRGRHGDEAYIMPQQEIAALVREQQAEFVKISSGGVCIAAMLSQIDGKSYTFLRLGWLDNNTKYVKQGAITALYWFLIQRVFQLQCSRVFLGGTPSFLEDGVLRFKAKWGGCLYGKRLGYGHRHLLLDPGNPVYYRFLQNYSLLAYGTDDSFIILSSKSPDRVAVPKRFLAGIKSWYVLRADQSNQVQEVDELPPVLKHWYEKVSITKHYAEI